MPEARMEDMAPGALLDGWNESECDAARARDRRTGNASPGAKERAA
jgi:hypothetical protein